MVTFYFSADNFYNLFIEKFKNIANKYLKLEGDKNEK